MNTRRLFALGFILAATAALVAADYPRKKTPPAETSPAAKKKEYELPTTGKNVARQNGGWLNVEGAGTRFVVKFFDKDMKPIPPDVERGFARFNYAAKNDARAPLSREGETLVTPATIRPPHNFQVILSLFTGEVGDSAEVYTFHYP